MISVISPVYQSKKFIEGCILNVIDQKCTDLEHIILDGGSTDGTLDIIKRYAKEYPHIKYLSEPDTGQSQAMNKGIKMAKGNILGILNVDDYYEPQTLNFVLNRFKSLPEPTMITGNCNMWKENNVLKEVSKPSNTRFEELFLGFKKVPFPVNPVAYFYHKSVHEQIGMYDENDHYSMDVDFLLRAFRMVNIKYIDKIFGNFRFFKGTKTIDIGKVGVYENCKICYNRYVRYLSFKQRVRVFFCKNLEIPYELCLFWRFRLRKIFFRHQKKSRKVERLK